MPLNDIPAQPVWQEAPCDRRRGSFDGVRLQLDAAQTAFDRQDITALAIALNLGMARYMEAVNAAYDMIVAPAVESKP